VFENRTRSVVEAHYKTSLSTTDPWIKARNALFTSLMAGFADLGAFIHSLAVAIGGALDAGVKGTLQTISTFMTGFVNAVTYIANALGQALTNLFTATGEFIADIGKAIVDGVNNFGTFLADMWDAITGNDGTPTAPYTAGAPTIKSSNIRTALRGQRAVAQSSINSGSNLAPNPGFEDTNFFIGSSANATYSTTLSKDGTRSLKLIGLSGSYIGTNIISNDKQTVFVPCVAGEVYYVEGYVRGDSANGSSTSGYAYIQAEVKTKDPVTSVISTVYSPIGTLAAGTAASTVWNKISGYITMPANSFQFNVGCFLHTSMATGKIYYFDAITVREVTAAGQTWNTLWDSYSGTTGSTGKTPADVATKTSENYNSTTEYSRSGSNLIADPGFENITLDSLRAGCFNGSTWSYATAGVSGGVAHSGTRSLKCDWGGGQPYVLLTSSGRSGDKMPVRGGQTFYVSQWVFAPTANTGSNTVGMFLECTDSAGVSTVNYPGYTQVITENAWVKMEAYLRVPDTGYDRVRFYMCGVRTGAVTGDDFYFDDVEVYEVTHSQNVVDKIYQGASGSTTSTGNSLDSVRVQIAGVNSTAGQGVADASTAAGAASLAQQNIDVKAKDFTNLVAGSDFDAATQPWALTTGFTMSTAQKNSGTQSMLISGTATANPTITYNLSKTFEAKPGEQFYMELWARKSSTYVGGDTTGPRFRMVRGNGVSAGTTIDQITLRASDITAADTWQKLSVTTVAVPSDTSSVYFALTGMPASAAGSLWVDDIVVRRVLEQDTVKGLPDRLIPVSDTLIEHAQDIVDLKAAREVTSNQGRTISVSFIKQANSASLPTTGTQTWSTQYLSGSGPTFGISSGKAAWVGGLSTRTAKVLYRGTESRQLISTGTAGTFTLTLGATTTSPLAHNATAAAVLSALGSGNVTVSGTSALSPGLTITPVSTVSGALSITSSVTGGTATLSDGGETTLTDYQSLRGVLADPPGIFGNENSGFTALARVSQDSNSYVFARAYWQAGLQLKGKIGYSNNGVETVWQDLIPLTWSTELTFRLGVDDNPRSYQVFSGSTLVTSYDEGYLNFAAFPATGRATTRTYVDNTGTRLNVTGTGGTFTLTVGNGVTTGTIAFNATAAAVTTALDTALNTALLTTGVSYTTVTGTAANTVASPGGLVITFNSKVKGLTVGNPNVTVNAGSITGGSASATNRYTWSGTAFVPSVATSGVGAASPLGASSRRFGAEVRVSGSNTSGTISSVAVSDNPPVIYAGSVARISRLNTGNIGTITTTDTALPTSFFDDVDFESLDVDANLTDGSFTVTTSKMYLVTARVKLSTYLDANGYLNLQVWDGSAWSLAQKGGSLWGADTGSFAINPANGFVLTATWLQYLNSGHKVRLSAQVDRNSRPTVYTGGSSAETYFSISGLS
jgi:hypothetical protein